MIFHSFFVCLAEGMFPGHFPTIPVIIAVGKNTLKPCVVAEPKKVRTLCGLMTDYHPTKANKFIIIGDSFSLSVTIRGFPTIGDPEVHMGFNIY